MTEVGGSLSSFLFEVLLMPWVWRVMLNPLTFSGAAGLKIAGNGWGLAIYDYGQYFLVFYLILAAIDYRRSSNATRLLLLVALPGFILQFADLIVRLPQAYIWLFDDNRPSPLGPFTFIFSSAYIFSWIPFVVFITTILMRAIDRPQGTLVWRMCLLLCVLAYFATYLYVGWWVENSRGMGV